MFRFRNIIIIFVILLGFFEIYCLFLRGPGYVAFTNTFLQEMKEKADIPAIRTWLNGLPENKEKRYEICESEWPDWGASFILRNIFMLIDEGAGNDARSGPSAGI